MAGSRGRANKRRKGANGKRTREEGEDEQQQMAEAQDQPQAQQQLVTPFSREDQTPVPAEVVQVIGSYLGRKDLPAARLVCKCWSGHIAEATTSISSLVGPDCAQPTDKMKTLSKIFPLTRHVTLLVASTATSLTMHALAQRMCDFRRLEHLTLCNISPSEPIVAIADTMSRRREGFIKHLAQISNLTSLTLNNWPFPAAAAFEAFKSMAKLTRLVLDSEGLGTKPGAVSGFKTVSEFRATPKDLQGLSHLTQLQSLVIRCDHEPIPSSELTSLSKLTKLTSLDLGQWNVNKTNLQAITHLASLKELHIRVDSDTTPREAALHSLRKLQELHLKVPGGNALAEELPYLFKHFSKSLRGFSTRAIAPSTYEAALPLLVGTGVHEVSLSLHSSLTKLQGLGQLRSLRTLILAKNKAACSDMPAVLNSVFESSGSTLQRLTLDGWTSQELQPSTLRQLGRLSNLRELSIHGGDQTTTMLQVDLSALPSSLELLSLKYVYLPCPTFHGRLRNLQTLALRHCSLACFEHFQTAVEGLTSLRSLDLDDIPRLTDRHLEQLSCLTQLTSLGVGAIGNQQVTNLPLATLKPLTELLRLRWCAGDMLDAVMDPLHLQHFTKLCIVCISTSMYWRMSRWGATDKLPSSYCDFETIGA